MQKNQKQDEILLPTKTNTVFQYWFNFNTVNSTCQLFYINYIILRTDQLVWQLAVDHVQLDAQLHLESLAFLDHVHTYL